MLIMSPRASKQKTANSQGNQRKRLAEIMRTEKGKSEIATFKGEKALQRQQKTQNGCQATSMTRTPATKRKNEVINLPSDRF